MMLATIMVSPGRRSWWILPLAALAIVLAATGAAHAQQPLLGYVTRVVDGDTIYVAIGSRIEAVRYIGINTPQTHHLTDGREPFGEEAYRINHQLVDGKWVTLVLDVQHRDRHGRLLAYVWVDGRFVNGELVHRGYAEAATYPPNVQYVEYFDSLEQDARAGRRGLWAGPTSGSADASAFRWPRMKTPETDTVGSSMIFSAPLPRDAPVAKGCRVYVHDYVRDDGVRVRAYTRSCPGPW